jgi:hypothetical protein
LGVILGEEFAAYLSMYVICLNCQKKHQILQKMLQIHLEEEINIPKEA